MPKKVSPSVGLINMQKWAIDLIKGNGITDVWIERPIFPSHHQNFDSVAKVAGYAFVLGMAAAECGCHCALIDLGTWRSSLGLPTQGPKNVLADPVYAARYGKNKNGLKEAKRAWVKDRAMDYVRKMGAEPKDDNESDAICIWLAVAAAKRNKIQDQKYDLFNDLTI